jgi:uncharacterized surface protein with fasciclin (FAS1) repeats
VFAATLRNSDHVRDLEEGGPFTLFAPTDEAFEKLSSAARDRLLGGDRALLREVIGFHFAKGQVLSTRFGGKHMRAVTKSGDLTIDGRRGLRVNGANVVDPDIKAANGVMHGIDAVLWPKTAAIAMKA